MSLTDSEAQLIQQIYPENLQPAYEQNYLALKAFIEQNQRYPNEFQTNGQPYPRDHPERRLAMFVKTARQTVLGSPAIRQLMEQLPNWSWRSREHDS